MERRRERQRDAAISDTQLSDIILARDALLRLRCNKSPLWSQRQSYGA